MNILVVTQCFWPDIYTVNDIVETLVARGHTVTVLTGLPDYTTSKIPPEYRRGKNRRQIYKGAKVYRCPTIARHHGAFFRCLNYLSFVFSGWWYAAFRKWDDFDVIYVWEVSPVTMAVPAIQLKKRYHKPLFLYCMDIWPECVKAMNFGEDSLLFKLVHRWSAYIYRQCDHIAVSSRPFFDYLEQVNGCDQSKMSYLPQYGSSELLEHNLKKEPNGHTDFLFVGNIGKVADIPVILKACSVLKKSGKADNITVHIVGGGSELSTCQQLAKQLELAGLVRFYGPIPIADTLEFYRRADACLLTLNGDNKIGDTLPGKLQTYMAAGKPVIGAINGAGQQVIEDSKCGLCVPAGDSAGLAGAMLLFIEERTKFRDCGKRARDYFENEFMKEKHFEELEIRLKTLAWMENTGMLQEITV